MVGPYGEYKNYGHPTDSTVTGQSCYLFSLNSTNVSCLYVINISFNKNENDTLLLLLLWFLFQTWLSKIIFSNLKENIQEQKILEAFHT